MTDGEEMLSLIRGRQSERKYLDKPVEREKIERITGAGRLSPSACNGQPWHFIVVDEPALRDEVAAATESVVLRMNSFVREAPVLIVVVREKSNFSSRAGDLIKQKDYSLIDIGIATASIVYQAAAEGLGTCIIGWVDDKRVRKVLGIPASRKVELVISVGYTDNRLRDKSRKPPEEIITYNRY
ncbi:MAG: nitroreductase family protein [Bacteroidales bacterium]|jgi:nitroreductase|nr:nitroreductase family protein [Bacteroidales bacterium]MDX9926420.1 nitroreductase family protein [Bacteroidales bacterium]HNX83031.1 nitroreductase family protein [Bacteroidales bacterium]HPS96512.1 nitroreductase family protein [Bacteroidales bacterium]